MERNIIAKDFTNGSMLGKILSFSWPLMLSNLLQIMYNIVDMAVVGRFVGSAGLAAVSSGADLLNFSTNICIGLSSAGQIIISQYIGKGDREGVKKTIGTLFMVIIIAAVFIMSLGLLLIDPILNALNIPPESFQMCKQYSVCCFLGLIFVFGYNLVSVILRGMGDSKHPFIFIAIAAVINLVLDLVFVAGFGWGPMGAAIATVIGQAVSLIFSLFYLYRHRKDFGFDFSYQSFKINGSILSYLLKLGIPLALQTAAVTSSKLFVNSYINSYGVVAAAVNGVGVKISHSGDVVAGALSIAAITVIGQNFGAGKLERIKKTIYVILGLGCAFATVFSIVILLFPMQIFGVFNKDPAVLAMAHSYVIVAVVNFFGYALRNPMTALISGTGNAKLQLLLSLLDGVMGRIFLSILFGITLKMGIRGFWYGDMLSSLIPFILGGAYFISGAWKRRKLSLNY